MSGIQKSIIIKPDNRVKSGVIRGNNIQVSCLQGRGESPQGIALRCQSEGANHTG